jgi:WD40 repeat protein/biotin carboxyl carrier protein
MRSALVWLALAVPAAGLILWAARGGADPADEQTSRAPAQGGPPISAEPVASLTKQGKEAPSLGAPARALHDPVVVTPCNLFPAAEQDVSSQVEGVLRSLDVELGRRVADGDVLGRLDDRQVRPQVELLQIKAASRSAERIAKALYDEADAKVKYAEAANKSGLQAVPELEHQTYLCQRERYAQEMRKAREERRVAEKELERARQVLDLHRIRAGLAGEVVRVYKRQGEAVKPAEPLFRVARFERLRVEGLCKISQAALLRVGMRALVEPEVRAEELTRLGGHTGTVHGLAASGDGRLLASAGEDRCVLLWSWPGGLRVAQLPHAAEVYAVAFVPAARGGGYQILTGAADGQARLWRVSPRGRVGEPVRLTPAHEGAIRAVAVSPDGKRCATAGEDRRVGVWDLASRRRLYWLEDGEGGSASAHQGAVTAVHFTPDGFLVSAGRDNALRVWRLGEGGGRLVARHAGRTGDVAHLGVSPDGRRLLFDHGEELRLLDRDDGSGRGTLRGTRQGQFQGLALFSPTGSLVLTGANNGRLQLWRAPAAPEQAALLRGAYRHGFDRGSLAALGALAGPLALTGPAARDGRLPRLWPLHGQEIRYFAVPNASATCAAFAPDESVVFTAGTDRVIHVWPVPPAGRRDLPLEAAVTFVGSQVERGTDGVRVRAELVNPADPDRRLRPGMFASLRLYPETAGAGTPGGP